MPSKQVMTLTIFETTCIKLSFDPSLHVNDWVVEWLLLYFVAVPIRVRFPAQSLVFFALNRSASMALNR